VRSDRLAGGRAPSEISLPSGRTTGSGPDAEDSSYGMRTQGGSAYRGRMIRRLLARAFWRLSPWKLVTEPAPTRPTVLIGAPHTSNWDFVLMLAIAWDLGIPVRYLGKDTLFRGPFGWVMRALGGIPVDRKDPAGLVDELVARAEAGERFYLVVTPEGTRSAGKYWKSGFLRIAR